MAGRRAPRERAAFRWGGGHGDPLIPPPTERLRFRDHVASDSDAYLTIESDPVYRAPQIVHPREEIIAGFWRGPMQPRPLGLRAAERLADGVYLGRAGLYVHPEDPEAAVLAFYIGRPYWNQGYATEAGRAFLRAAFTASPIQRVEAGVNAENGASIRVIEKLGLRRFEVGEGSGSRWYGYEMRRSDAPPELLRP